MSQTPIPSDPVFRTSRGMKCVMAFVLVPTILLFTLGPAWLLVEQPNYPEGPLVLLALGLLVSALLGYFIVAGLRSRIELLPSALRFTRGLSAEVEIPYDEIAGYRLMNGGRSKVLKLILKDGARGPVAIGESFERQGVLERFLEARFGNLDKSDLKADMDAVLSDPHLGSTEPERRDALKTATIQAGILNTLTGALVLWAMVYPRPYGVVIALLAILPFLGVGLVVMSRGAVTLDSNRKSVRPTAGYSILGPTMVIALRGLEDWHILGWSGFWLPFAVLSGILIGFLLVCSAADGSRKRSTLVLLCIFFAAESYGLTLFLNCQFDHSVPVIHRTSVVARRISRGRKHTSYYLTVSPWIDGRYSEEISVPSSTYGWHEEGSTVLIGVRQGSLEMPWFFVQ